MTSFFKPFYKSFVIIIFYVQLNRNYCQTYDRSNQGHTSVPTEIPSRMRYIYLFNNDISHINDESFNETFTDFSIVHQLRLGYNKIENVSERAFEGFQSLTAIQLHRNQLQYILFKEEDIPQLENLLLNFNRLTQIPTFYGFFQSYRSLKLEGNLISHVCVGDFENITHIRDLYLGRNRLVTFEPRQELSNLANLNLDNNELTEIPALKGTYKFIRAIDIANNNITLESLLKLKERINGSEQSLTEIYLGGNEDLANNLPVVVNFLQLFPKLNFVALRGLEINKIFHMSNNPEILDFSWNNISQITKDDFNVSYEYGDFTLHLRGNPIQSLPNLYEYLKDFNANKTMIYLTAVKFHCDNLCWMKERG